MLVEINWACDIVGMENEQLKQVSNQLDSATYEAFDRILGRVVRTVPGTKRNSLRRWADRQDMAYGACRITVRPVFTR